MLSGAGLSEQGSRLLQFRMRNLSVRSGTAANRPGPSCIDNSAHAEGSLSSAVAGALHDAEVYAPWADGFAVLVGHNPGDLVQVS